MARKAYILNASDPKQPEPEPKPDFPENERVDKIEKQ